MPAFVNYWGNFQLQEDWGTKPVDHIAGNQLGKLKPNDLVWIVTFSEGRLWLFARIDVDVVTTQREAARRLKKKPSDLWSAKWHILARPGTAQPVKKVDLTAIARDLRFEGPNPRLPTEFTHHHLRTMRTLLPESSTLLEHVWGTTSWAPADELDEELAAFEGATRSFVILHRSRERKLREAKIRSILDSTGSLICEVPRCGFDFAEVYGELGSGYAHVHHLRPLSDRSRAEATRLADLVVVCANCHAMIHRGGKCRDIKALRLRQLTTPSRS